MPPAFFSSSPVGLGCFGLCVVRTSEAESQLPPSRSSPWRVARGVDIEVCQEVASEVFESFDQNGDGSLDFEENRQGRGGGRKGGVGGLG